MAPITNEDMRIIELLRGERVLTAKLIAKELGFPEKKCMNSKLDRLADRLVRRDSDDWLRCRKLSGERAGKIWWVQQRNREGKA